MDSESSSFASGACSRLKARLESGLELKRCDYCSMLRLSGFRSCTAARCCEAGRLAVSYFCSLGRRGSDSERTRGADTFLSFSPIGFQLSSEPLLRLLVLVFAWAQLWVVSAWVAE